MGDRATVSGYAVLLFDQAPAAKPTQPGHPSEGDCGHDKTKAKRAPCFAVDLTQWHA